MSPVTRFKLIGLLDGLYFSTIVTSLYAVSVGLSISGVVLAQAIYSTTVFLMEIPTGIVADKFGKKASMLCGFTMGIIGIFIFILNPTLITLLLMRVFQATGNALNSGAREALLYDICREQKISYKKTWAQVLSLGTFGQALTGISAGLCLKFFGSSAFIPLFIATNVMQLGAALITLTLQEKRNSDSQVENELKAWHIFMNSVRLFRRNAVLFALAAVGFLTVANEYFLYQSYGPYLQSLHVSPFWVGTVFTIGLLLNALFQRNVYRLERYMTLEKILFVINMPIGLAYIGLGLVPNPIMLTVLVISIIALANVENPIVSDYANQEIDSSIRSTVLSGMSLISRFSKLLLTFIIGALITGHGAAIGYLIQGGFVVVGICFGYWLLVRCGCSRPIYQTK